MSVTSQRLEEAFRKTQVNELVEEKELTDKTENGKSEMTEKKNPKLNKNPNG